jgi:DNA-binding NtrC family response regulator
MLEVFKLLERVVPTDAPLLITGESGTGKELVAKYVHHNGPRRKKPMVSVNCSALSDALLENELFGHHKGAFTGAHDQKVGLFQLADGGSLFLDEVGDMSRDMQKKLLRVLENGEVRPIGSKDVHHVNVRIITATNQDLELLTRQGKFREDLFFRLNVIHVHLPPLRERREDIPILIQHFTCKISEELKRSVGELPTEILQRFLNCDWPGNVRQLANELRRVYILDSKYRPEQMVETLSAPSQENAVTEKLVSMERKVILKALEVTGGNKSRAASLLGIPRRTFYDKLNKYKLP